MKRQTRVASSALVSWNAAILLMIFSAAPLLAQAGRPSSPTPPPNQPEATGAPESAVPGIDNLSRSGRSSPLVRLPPASSMMRMPTTLESLKNNLDELQQITAKLQQAISTAPSPDYQALVTYAELIQRLAKCIQSSTGLGTTTARDSQPSQTKEAMVGNVPKLVSAIDAAVKKFANGPVAQRAFTIDVEVIAEAGLELGKIITLSAELRKQAEGLSASPGPNSGVAGRSVPRRRYKRLPYLQLTVDCSVWTADLFSNQPARVKKDWPLEIEGAEIQVKHHTLTERQLFSLEECMPCSFDEKAIAEGEHYAALLKDFYSYEVKERTFAYHVTYEVVRTKNGKISARLVQLVTLFFIDAGGQGEFELAQGNRPLASLPEWVRVLVPSRWATTSKRD